MILTVLLLMATAPQVVVQTGQPNASTLAFSVDGRQLAVGTSTGLVSVWDMRSGKQMSKTGGFGTQIRGLGATSKGWFACALEEREIHAVEGDKTVPGWSRFAVVPNARNLIVVASPERDFDLILYDIERGAEVRRFKGFEGKGIEGYVWTIGVSPDGTLVAGAGDKETRVWRVSDGRLLATFKAEWLMPETLSFSPDNKLLAAAGRGPKEHVRIWDLESRTLASSMKFEMISPGAFYTKNELLVADDLRGVSVWDWRGQKQLRTIPAKELIESMAVSPDGRLLATSNDSHEVEVFEVATGRLIRLLRERLDRPWGVALGAKPGQLEVVNDQGAYTLDLANGRMQHLGKRAWPDQPKGWDELGNDSNFPFSVATSKTRAAALIINKETLASRSIQTRAPAFGRVFFGPYGHRFALKHNGGFGVYDEKGLVDVFDAVDQDEVFLGPNNLAYTVGVRSGGGAVHDIKTNAELLRLRSKTTTWYATFDPSEQHLLLAQSSDGDTAVTLWNIADKKLVWKKTLNEFSVKKMMYTADGKQVIIVADSTHIWSASDATEVAQVVFAGHDDFVMVTPDGYYLATRGALDAVAFRVGARVFPFEQFDATLNRPDIVMQRLGYASEGVLTAVRRAHDKRMQKLGAPVISDQVPEVELDSLPITTKQRELTVHLRARSPAAKLVSVTVHINDVPVTTLPLAQNEATVPVVLSQGRNKLQVWVTDERGVDSFKETAEVTFDGEPRKPNLVVLSVGVSKYKDSQYTLAYAAKDARDLAALLKTQGGRFGAVRVEQLLDADVTREKVLAAKTKLQETEVDDHVVVFFAGHGLLDDAYDYYFATADIDFAAPAKRGLLYADIENLLDGIPARNKLLLIDTCNSGEVDKDDKLEEASGKLSGIRARGFKRASGKAGLSQREGALLIEQLFADLRRGSGAAVISSASGVELALESDVWNNGVFTYAVLDGLKNRRADADHNGDVRVSELRDYVTTRVLELTQGLQRPTARRSNLENDFTLWSR